MPRPPPVASGRGRRAPARASVADASGDWATPAGASGDRVTQARGSRARVAQARSSRAGATRPRASGERASVPRATQAAGRSALAAWKRERRARRRRLAVVVLLAIVAVAALAASVLRQLGVLPLAGGPWPLLAIGIGAGGAGVAVWPRFDPDRWSRGAAGELATALLLEELPKARWAVLHDLALPGSRANVDHLVIGPTGVWVVDTKAYRARVTARWGRVSVGGVRLSSAPVRWEARVVSEVLGKKARPAIAVHARGLPRRGRRLNGVRVLPAEQLVRRLQRRRYLWSSLRPREVRELAELAEARLARP